MRGFFLYIRYMKKLLLLSFLFIGCNNTQNNSLPMPSDIAIWETPSDETFERWEKEIDTIWKKEYLGQSFFAQFLQEEMNDLDEDTRYRLKIKYEDIKWQIVYDMYRDLVIDSSYYTYENLNKYETLEDYMKATFPRFAEFGDEIDAYYD